MIVEALPEVAPAATVTGAAETVNVLTAMVTVVVPLAAYYPASPL